MKYVLQYFRSDHVYITLFMALAVFVVATEPVFAQDFNAITTMINKVKDLMTGDLGTAAAIIAVVCTGIMFITGRMDWIFALTIIVGIAIIFGATQIVSDMGG